jgi:hypothetical protein
MFRGEGLEKKRKGEKRELRRLIIVNKKRV